MTEQTIPLLATLAGVYLVAGLVVAVLLFTRWLKTVEPAAVGGTWGFRVLVTPGIVALWPVILVRVFHHQPGGRAEGAEALRRNHRLTFIGLTIAIAIIFIAALVWRAPAFTDLPALEFSLP